MPEESRLHIDDDWKAEAASEKERLQQAAGRPAEPDLGATGPMPEAGFSNLLAGLRAQALVSMGLVRDPETNEPLPRDKDQAKYVIDTLAMLETKTAGNLTKEEKDLLDAVLYELRLNFLRM